MEYIAIIPARYASTRFPGKALALIDGKPMIQHVYEQARKALSEVIVATDDTRIADAVKSFDGRVVMTSNQHNSGTDRIQEAYQQLCRSGDGPYDVIINVQGDEPLIDPSQIHELMNSFGEQTIKIATLIRPIKSGVELFNHNVTKVLVNKQGIALYFSRTPLPYIRGFEASDWLNHHTFYKHVGIYAYKADTLGEITSMGPSSLEMAESLEQNRWIENGYRIRAVVTGYDNYPVDTPDDLAKIIKDHFSGR